jgi:hypothetical protein
MKKNHYVAKWAQVGHPSIANVSFEAMSDHHAKLQADGIARKLGVTRTPRTIQRTDVGATYGMVVECIMRGVSDEG